MWDKQGFEELNTQRLIEGNKLKLSKLKPHWLRLPGLRLSVTGGAGWVRGEGGEGSNKIIYSSMGRKN